MVRLSAQGIVGFGLIVVLVPFTRFLDEEVGGRPAVLLLGLAGVAVYLMIRTLNRVLPRW
jgi:hypothetical protein